MMDLNAFRWPDLELICSDMGISIVGVRRKPPIIEAIRQSGADDDKLRECWERFQSERPEGRELAEKQKVEAREREKRAEAREHEKHEIEMRRLKFQLAKINVKPSTRGQEGWKMKNLLQPYKMGEDMGLFLVNFERACERAECSRESWPQRLLTVLPCDAAGVVARLTREESEDYDKVKLSLLNKYRLSTEAFRKRFRAWYKNHVFATPDRYKTLLLSLTISVHPL